MCVHVYIHLLTKFSLGEISHPNSFNRNCLEGFFYCSSRDYNYRHIEQCYPYSMICNGKRECSTPDDERGCDYNRGVSIRFHNKLHICLFYIN